MDGKTDVWQGTLALMILKTLETLGALHGYGIARRIEQTSGNLLDVNGKLYCTTYVGGTAGSGTVFNISTSGKEHLLYNFKGGLYGDHPSGGLILLKGVLYGTTSLGGARNRNRIGCGTIFSVRPSGAETVRFTRINGCYPTAGLISLNGALYGATSNGGPLDKGTVFEFTP